jgi:hypothetical protein
LREVDFCEKMIKILSLFLKRFVESVVCDVYPLHCKYFRCKLACYGGGGHDFILKRGRNCITAMSNKYNFCVNLLNLTFIS